MFVNTFSELLNPVIFSKISFGTYCPHLCEFLKIRLGFHGFFKEYFSAQKFLSF